MIGASINNDMVNKAFFVGGKDYWLPQPIPPPPMHKVACFGHQNQYQRDDITFHYIGSWSVIRE